MSDYPKTEPCLLPHLPEERRSGMEERGGLRGPFFACWTGGKTRPGIGVVRKIRMEDGDGEWIRLMDG